MRIEVIQRKETAKFRGVVLKVRDVVDRIGDPLMKDIIEAIPEHKPDFIKTIVRAMVQDGILRMKEDSIDHEYSYRKGTNW